MSRQYDIVVFGCTGNVGKAICELLHGNLIQEPLTWAVAGRRRTSLEQLQKDMPSCAGILVADVKDYSTVIEMVRSARTVINTVGPFERYGEPVVKACVEAGTHYVDITGEVKWVKSMRRAYDAPAKANGTVVLNLCGYDSIPAELTTLLGARAVMASDTAGPGEPVEVECAFRLRGKGGFPRGTLHTVLDGVENQLSCRKRSSGRSASDEHKGTGVPLLSAAGKRVMRRAIGPVAWLPSWSKHLGSFTSPHFMMVVNAPVVIGAAEHSGITIAAYAERLVLGRPTPFRLWGLIPSLMYMMLQIFVVIAVLLPPCRWLLRWYLNNRYTYGGNRDAQSTITTHVRSRVSGRVAKVALACPGDPGIFCTAVFTIVCAQLLAKDNGELSTGVSTPGLVLAAHLPDALRAAGCTLNIETK